MFTFAFRPWLKKRLLLKLSIKEFKKRRRQKRRQRHKSIISLGMVLVVEAHSFPRASLSENCSLLGTDNVRGQISEHVFAPNEGYCLFSVVVCKGNRIGLKEIVKGHFTTVKRFRRLFTWLRGILMWFLSTCLMLNFPVSLSSPSPETQG